MGKHVGDMIGLVAPPVALSPGCGMAGVDGLTVPQSISPPLKTGSVADRDRPVTGVDVPSGTTSSIIVHHLSPSFFVIALVAGGVLVMKGKSTHGYIAKVGGGGGIYADASTTGYAACYAGTSDNPL